jgi:hypothetical protein
MRSCLSCGRITAATRCDECRRATYRARQRTRDPQELAFYCSTAWRNLAARVVAEADRCATCGRLAEYAPLTGGHRLSVRARPDLALEPENVIAQCRSCQNLAQHPRGEEGPRGSTSGGPISRYLSARNSRP